MSALVVRLSEAAFENQRFTMRHSARKVRCVACSTDWRVMDSAGIPLALIPCPDCDGTLKPLHAREFKRNSLRAKAD